MAKNEIQFATVVCKKCGAVIQPNRLGIPTDYVWRDGTVLCNECNKKEGSK